VLQNPVKPRSSLSFGNALGFAGRANPSHCDPERGTRDAGRAESRDLQFGLLGCPTLRERSLRRRVGISWGAPPFSRFFCERPESDLDTQGCPTLLALFARGRNLIWIHRGAPPFSRFLREGGIWPGGPGPASAFRELTWDKLAGTPR